MGGGVGAIFYTRDQHQKRMQQEEKGGIVLMWSLQNAQQYFKEQDYDENGVHDYWVKDIVGLYRKGMSWPAGEAADATPGRPGPPPVPFKGFFATAMQLGEPGAPEDRSHYAICVYPASYRSLGRYTWIFNDSGETYYRELEGKPVLHWPRTDELSREWKH
jgi:hypothetical protein